MCAPVLEDYLWLVEAVRCCRWLAAALERAAQQALHRLPSVAQQPRRARGGRRSFFLSLSLVIGVVLQLFTGGWGELRNVRDSRTNPRWRGVALARARGKDDKTAPEEHWTLLAGGAARNATSNGLALVLPIGGAPTGWEKDCGKERWTWRKKGALEGRNRFPPNRERERERERSQILLLLLEEKDPRPSSATLRSVSLAARSSVA